jgi:hypothetical protein
MKEASDSSVDELEIHNEPPLKRRKRIELREEPLLETECVVCRELRFELAVLLFLPDKSPNPLVEAGRGVVIDVRFVCLQKLSFTSGVCWMVRFMR